MTQLNFERLREAVAGEAVAVRSRVTLQPAGGEGDKVFRRHTLWMAVLTISTP